jgi:mannose PTS system EIIA component
MESGMIGLVIVTHGNLAREFRAALEHVVGPQEQLATICIKPDDDMEERRNAILKAVGHVDSGDGCVLLTDMFGGTPSNLSISVMDDSQVEVIAGINLPMLVKLAQVREEVPIKDAIRQAADAGRKYIHVASQVLTGR